MSWGEATGASEGGEKEKGNLVLASEKEMLRKNGQEAKIGQ